MSEFKLFYEIVKGDVFQRQETPINMTRPRALAILEIINQQLSTPKSLLYFKMPPVTSYPLDLNVGYEDYKIRTEVSWSDRLMGLEQHFLAYHKMPCASLHKEKQQICTFRHVVKVIMNTPYRLSASKYNDWCVKAIKFENVIYLIESEGAPTVTKTPNRAHYFKFKQICFTDSPSRDSNSNVPVDENSKLCCKFCCCIENFGIHYTGYIDGIESSQELQDVNEETLAKKCNIVATKLVNDSEYLTWRNTSKAVSWWLEGYLCNINKLFIGIRTKDGLINKKIQCIKNGDLLKDGKFKPQVCKKFLHDFLSRISSEMANVNCPYTTYEFKFDSNTRTINYRIFEGKSKESFLRDEFIQYIRTK